MLDSVQFEVTETCNHKCLYCYNGDRASAIVNSSFTKEHYSEIAAKLTQLDTHYIVFTGGEPLIVIDKLWESIEIIKSKGIKIEFNTNATLLTPEIAKRFAELGINLLVSFISSDPYIFDKTTQTAGSFDNALRGVKIALENGVETRLNMIITKLNKDTLYSTAEYIKELNSHYDSKCSISVAAASVPYYIESMRNELEITKEESSRFMWDIIKIRDRLGVDIIKADPTCLCQFDDKTLSSLFHIETCVPGAHTITISPNGDIRPCPRSTSVYDNILTTANVNVIMQQIISDYTKRDAKCIECPAFTQCYGGCPIQSEVRTGKKYGMCYEARPDKVPELIEKGIIQVH